jgi:hypothetical protein
MTQPVDRFRAAMLVLAGNGRVKQRLTKCYEEYLSDIDDDELPIALKQTFADLRQNLQSVAPLNGESAACASVRKMSPRDASECAGEIVKLFAELSRMRNDGHANLPLAEDQPVPVPPFLVKSV